MERYQTDSYGERVAGVYDEWFTGMLDTDGAVERLADLAGPGPVLELGVGTGRLALPLAERGLEVHGIDSSAAMLRRLAAKPGGERVHATVGDMAEAAVDGPFQLVFAAANTLFMLTSQEDQVRCFANVSARLRPGGTFVIEAFVPDPTRYAARHQDLSVLHVDVDQVVLTAAKHDPVAQRIEAQQILLQPEGQRFVPGILRYAWPAELDLMARLAHLHLRHRWSTWTATPFTAASTTHISVYERE